MSLAFHPLSSSLARFAKVTCLRRVVLSALVVFKRFSSIPSIDVMIAITFAFGA